MRVYTHTYTHVHTYIHTHTHTHTYRHTRIHTVGVQRLANASARGPDDAPSVRCRRQLGQPSSSRLAASANATAEPPAALRSPPATNQAMALAGPRGAQPAHGSTASRTQLAAAAPQTRRTAQPNNAAT
eukprot:6169732-Lingulodinium_polyedra.AAC.1